MKSNENKKEQACRNSDTPIGWTDLLADIRAKLVIQRLRAKETTDKGYDKFWVGMEYGRVAELESMLVYIKSK